MAVTASTEATDSRLICFSTQARSSWMRPNISLTLRACPSLPRFMENIQSTHYDRAAAIRRHGLGGLLERKRGEIVPRAPGGRRSPGSDHDVFELLDRFDPAFATI